MKTALLALMPVLRGIEAVKGVKAKTMHDETAKDDTRYGTLIDHKSWVLHTNIFIISASIWM
ncbi:tyramine oxidase [Escherichia coli]|nr:tyramine oxidase [Escherichia coli]